ncbi:MAG: hypothetical protein VB031_07590 [Eubacteriaceae bacterium]|nr:hypothetical protein [Eubacteriaceae bacterium]
MENKKTYRIALGGICLALSAVSLYFASFIPGVELTMYALSSVFVCVAVAETGVKGGLLVYVGSAVLGFLLMPGKLGVLPYLCFFGIYPVLKLFAEKIKNRPLQMAVKLIFFAVIVFITYGLFRSIFFANIKLPDFGKIGLIVFALVMFLLYDFILTGVVAFYRRRIRREKEIKLS